MNKKISKEKVFEILKYVCIGLAIIVVVGLVGSLFTRSDGDGVRVPTNSRPSIEETEPAPVIKTAEIYIIGTGSPYYDPNPIVITYEEGMIWAEWCQSSYNTVNISCDGDYVKYGGSFDIFAISGSVGEGSYDNLGYVTPNHVISHATYCFED